VRWIPDWLIYIVAVVAIFVVLARFSQHQDSPEALPDAQAGAVLGPPSAFDPSVLVDVAPATTGLGTAFAISEDGWWVTARHVVDSCDKVGIVVARASAAPVDEVKVAQFADLALLKTGRAPVALALDTSENHFEVGERAYHVGYPQGRPGEAYSSLIGRENLVARGRYSLDEPVLVWAELGRTSGMIGSLGGISGGPAFASNGQVIGVTIAESARRGRLYTVSPSSLAQLLRLEHVDAEGMPAPRLTPQTYGEQSDALRRSLAVAQVVCVGPGAAHH
jgi:S1-C subfamily serine protease